MQALGTLFVLIWSTGFIVARAIMPVAGANLFLTARFFLAAIGFAMFALAAGVQWPKWREVPLHLCVGIVLNGIYVSGGYWAVTHGLSPAIMSLLGAMQPIFTVLIGAIWLKPFAIHRLFWYGLMIGLIGVILVLFPRLSWVSYEKTWLEYIVGIVAVISLTIGTILQKSKLIQTDIRSSMAIQNLGAALFTGGLAFVLQESHWEHGFLLYGALAWASLILSGVGTGLLILLARKGEVARVTTLMYLAPPLAAVESFLLFDTQLTYIQMFGFIFALLGVSLCHIKKSE